MNPGDEMEKNRVNGAAKIDEFSVRRIRAASKEGMTAPDLAALFGLAAETVRRIVRRETWAWVEDRPPAAADEILASQERMFQMQEDIKAKRLPAETAEAILEEIPQGSAVKHFAEPDEEKKAYLKSLGVKV